MSEESSGHIRWGDWFFDYGVFGTEGLCLVDGFFQGQPVFHKLSLPVIRVKYVEDESFGGLTSVPGPRLILGEGCGPYNDQITWDTEDFGENLNPFSGPHHLVKIECPGGGERYICQEEVTFTSGPVLRLSVYARIGAYHIVQSWFLDNGGGIMARVFSKGLSCNLDHWHHPYWRFDFALGIPERQRVSVLQQRNGPHIADIPTEAPIVNSSFSELPEYHIKSFSEPKLGFVERPAEAVVTPARRDSTKGIVGPTPFSSIDGYVRKFRPEEDRSWPKKDYRELQFPVHEPCDDSDIVFWSVAHLLHHADEGEDHWHSVGPDIQFTPMIVGGVPPDAKRLVKVSGNIDVKDFKLVGKDIWQHGNFAEELRLDPAAETGEVVKKVQAGDVTAELIVRVTWNVDRSVSVRFTGNLFDELERVSQVGNQFNVLQDTAIQLGGAHLVDHHRGDPDAADMSFLVENLQQP